MLNFCLGHVPSESQLELECERGAQCSKRWGQRHQLSNGIMATLPRLFDEGQGIHRGTIHQNLEM